MSWFHRKNEWPPNLPDLIQLDHHVWGAMLGCYQKDTPKPPNHPFFRAEDCLTIDME